MKKIRKSFHVPKLSTSNESSLDKSYKKKKSGFFDNILHPKIFPSHHSSKNQLQVIQIRFQF